MVGEVVKYQAISDKILYLEELHTGCVVECSARDNEGKGLSVHIKLYVVMIMNVIVTCDESHTAKCFG